MITRVRLAWPIGRDPADDEAGEVVRLARGGAPDLRFAGDRRQPRDVDAIRTGDQAHDRLEAVLLGSDEHERLHDLAELGAEGRGRLGRGVGGLGEGGHLERDALALRRRPGHVGSRDARRRLARRGV